MLADFEDWNDFLWPQIEFMPHQMVDDAVQQENVFIISSPDMSTSALLEEPAESVEENDICCPTPLQRMMELVFFFFSVSFSFKNKFYVNYSNDVLSQSQVSVMPPIALSSSVSDMGSLVRMTDRVSSSSPLNKSKAAVGEDLVGEVASRRRNCSRFGSTMGSSGSRQYRSGRMYASSRRLIDCEGFDLNSIFTQSSRIEVRDLLFGLPMIRT